MQTALVQVCGNLRKSFAIPREPHHLVTAMVAHPRFYSFYWSWRFCEIFCDAQHWTSLEKLWSLLESSFSMLMVKHMSISCVWDVLKQSWARAAGQKLLCSSYFYIKPLSASFPLKGGLSQPCQKVETVKIRLFCCKILSGVVWPLNTIIQTKNHSLTTNAMLLGGIKFKDLSGKDDCMATLTLHISIKDCRITITQIPA